MKAITILQPYAALICLPDDDPWAKRVENRTWGTHYRGELLIHAGRSRERLGEAEEYPSLRDFDPAFGAVVAAARLAGCFEMDGVRSGAPMSSWTVPWPWVDRFKWLAGHPHTEGPVCWILTEVRPLAEPVPCPGKQGLWTPSPALVEAVKGRLVA